MYREDMSTSASSSSSEDDTSTTGAESVSGTTTADMCRTKVRNGVKVLECTGCGYTSDRRANVTRHYQRIHGQLQQNRRCTCGEVFYTKWEFYKHCDKYHPTVRQSWYTTTHVYKLKQTLDKSKSKSDEKPARRVQSIKTPTIQGRVVTRASTRLSTQETAPDTSNDSSLDGNDSPSTSFKTENLASSPEASTSSSSKRQSSDLMSSFKTENLAFSPKASTSRSSDSLSSFKTENLAFSPKASTSRSSDLLSSFKDENLAASSSSEVSSPRSSKRRSSDSSSSFTSGDEVSTTEDSGVSLGKSSSDDTSNENLSRYAHLPIKKRYMSARRYLGDITNKVEVQMVYQFNDEDDSDSDSEQVSARDAYLAAMNEQQRAYLSHIDFDELDVILKIRDSQKSPRN